MINIYLVRHGETDLNRKKVYYGFTDVPLNSQGEAQCKRLKQKLINVKFDTVITSPLIRVVNSAEIITGLNKENFQIYNQLKELNFGKWEGMHYKDIEKEYPNEWNEWCKDWQNYCIPEGESFESFYERVKICFNQIQQVLKVGNVLIVGHEGVLKIIASIILNLEIENYWQFTFEFGTYSIFEIEDKLAVIRKINYF